MRNDADVLIVGAGPAGSTAAILLSQAGFKVSVVEKTVFPRRKVCGEFLSATSLSLLASLGVEKEFLELAGPPVREVGIMAGDSLITAPMPAFQNGPNKWGRALGREQLDLILLNEAKAVGAEIWQPWSVHSLITSANGISARIISRETGEKLEVSAPIVVAAHGSWEAGSLPSQLPSPPPQPTDLFGFKAHFSLDPDETADSRHLATHLMPLLSFAGGYGGMVHTDGGRISLSFCIRRKVMAQCREQRSADSAAKAVFHYLQQTCPAAGRALTGSSLDGAWLSAGPIRPGIRLDRWHGVFLIGNAAGEAHPVIAEGISMAIQSAWLLCQELIAARQEVLSGLGQERVARIYAHRWKRAFGGRVWASRLFARCAMSPRCASLLLPVLTRFPSLVSTGARIAGKTKQMISAEQCP
jgi:flavin-dependent dehydrogenase